MRKWETDGSLRTYFRSDVDAYLDFVARLINEASEDLKTGRRSVPERRK
jgi:hypothetical protein